MTIISDKELNEVTAMISKVIGKELLRDVFAMIALHGFMQKTWDAEEKAQMAYKQADIMMQKRAEGRR